VIEVLAVRRLGLGLLSVAAIVVFFVLEPDQTESSSVSLTPTNYQALVDLAMSDYDANAARTESAPQQQVVNGWVTRDLLQIQAMQLADLLEVLTEENDAGQVVAVTDPRTPALLVIAILAIALVGATSQDGSRLEDPRSPPQNTNLV
jgi:hypothetical protein